MVVNIKHLDHKSTYIPDLLYKRNICFDMFMYFNIKYIFLKKLGFNYNGVIMFKENGKVCYICCVHCTFCTYKIQEADPTPVVMEPGTVTQRSSSYKHITQLIVEQTSQSTQPHQLKQQQAVNC